MRDLKTFQMRIRGKRGEWEEREREKGGISGFRQFTRINTALALIGFE